MGIKITEERLKCDNKLPPDFRFFKWECLKNGKEYVGIQFTGGCCPLKTRGKYAGKPNYAKLTDQQEFVVTDEREAIYEADYECETGQCHACEGSGKVLKEWSSETGRVDQNCRRCGGTGKAP